MSRVLWAVLMLMACRDPQEPYLPDDGGSHGFGGGFVSGTGGGAIFCGSGGSAGGGSAGGIAEVNDGTSPPTIPARQPPPISGGTLAVMADETIVAADADRDELWLLPSGSMTPIRVPLATGDEPGRVVEGPAGRAFIALRGSGKVAELDVAGRSIAALHAACSAPRGLAWVAAQATLAVACATGELAQLKFSNGALDQTTRQFVADDLRDVVSTQQGLMVSTFRSAQLLAVGGGGSQSIMPAHAEVVPRVAWRTLSTARGPAVLHQQQTLQFVGSVCSGYGSSATGRPVAAAVTVPGGPRPMELIGGQLALVVDLAASADGTTWAVAAAGTRVAAIFQAGHAHAPTVVAGVGQPVAVAFRGNTLVVQSREPSALYLVGAFTQEVRLSMESRRATGHELFHAATNNAIACASCHPEGGDDGHTWALPEGRRRTPTLRGGLSPTAPFHWDGIFSGLDDLMSEIMVRRMGGAPQSTERVSALLGWLDSVPKVPAPPVDAASAARGEALFNGAAACNSCHAGALGTNNATVSVGTGVALQVPRLVELAGRAPYFHDGRVPSLEARFGPVGGDAHGNVTGLTQAQIADLVAYMRTR